MLLAVIAGIQDIYSSVLVCIHADIWKECVYWEGCYRKHADEKECEAYFPKYILRKENQPE